MRARLVISALVFIGVSACKHTASEEEIAQLEEMAQVVEMQPNPEIVIRGVAEAGLGYGSSCVEALNEYVKNDPSMKGRLGAEAVGACDFTCPGDIEPYADVPIEQKMTALLSACGAGDLVFTGAVAQERPRFDFFAYILVRGVLEHAFATLDSNGTPRALALKARLLALAPRLAPELYDPFLQKPQTPAPAL